jgi:hypothetical protein
VLKVLGSGKRLCDAVTRREMLRAGGLGLFSLGLADFLRLQEAQAAAGRGTFGQAKRVILLFLYGAAPQHELYDPKPDAPEEIRGKFASIPTAVPGLRVCEHLPNLARVADRATFIRSMTHPYNIHTVAYTLTGDPTVNVVRELLNPLDLQNWPFFGSVLDFLERQRNDRPREIPANIALPFKFSSRLPGLNRGGPYGGFLGRAHDPVWTEFEGQATRTIQRWTGSRDQAVADPYAGVTPDGRFLFSRAATLPPEITLDRLDGRRSLLEQLEQGRRELDRAVGGGGLDRFQQLAYSLLTSPKLHHALDVSREPLKNRERYGMTLFGQATLAGRRLLEAGAKLVTVCWDEYETVNSAWDTHFNHFERLEQELLPGLDRALSALLLDLEERGLLDETLVMCLTEHGRTPKLSQTRRGAGREHWSQAYCNLLAGGGIARGRVVGASDGHGAYVKSDPVSPKDVLATMYHVLGIDHRTTIRDRLGRDLPLVGEGDVVPALLG